MIVVCINDNWFTPDTLEYCKDMGIPISDWHPVKGSLYEVLTAGKKLKIANGTYLFYELFEDPKHLCRTWRSDFFKEVEVEIEDIEYEILEEITV